LNAERAYYIGHLRSLAPPIQTGTNPHAIVCPADIHEGSSIYKKCGLSAIRKILLAAFAKLPKKGFRDGSIRIGELPNPDDRRAILSADRQ
jgi:hypothetical protein